MSCLSVREDPDYFSLSLRVDISEKIDLRVRNFNVPPQEVIMGWSHARCHLPLVDIGHVVTR